MDRLIDMRFAIILVLAALYLYAPAAWADEYRYSGNGVRVIDGGSLIIDVPDWPRASGKVSELTRALGLRGLW